MTGVSGVRRWLLLHSPLVGPSSLASTAAVLRDAGDVVVLPDLTGVAAAPLPTWMVDRAVAEAGSADIVVAHSGAGALLPTVSASTGARAAVFLDAVLPTPGATTWSTEPAQQTLLHEHLGSDGRLAPWLSWWPDEVVERLLPDPVVRRAIAAECPRLPVSFYEHPVPLPATWVPCAYVALGGAYADEEARAAALGWPVRSLGRSHLATVTHPDAVVAALLEVVADLG